MACTLEQVRIALEKKRIEKCADFVTTTAARPERVALSLQALTCSKRSWHVDFLLFKNQSSRIYSLKVL